MGTGRAQHGGPDSIPDGEISTEVTCSPPWFHGSGKGKKPNNWDYSQGKPSHSTYSSGYYQSYQKKYGDKTKGKGKYGKTKYRIKYRER